MRQQYEHLLAERFKDTHVTPFLFPLTVMFLVFGSWVFMTSFDTCILQRADPKFDCWSSIQFAAIFACIGSVLTGLMALLARVLLHPFLPFDTRRQELISALLSSLVLVLFSYSVIRWDINVGHIGIQLFGWLGVSFVVCGASLMVVKHLNTRGRGCIEPPQQSGRSGLTEQAQHKDV